MLELSLKQGFFAFLLTFLLSPNVMAQDILPVQKQVQDEPAPIGPVTKILQGGAERDTLLQQPVQAPVDNSPPTQGYPQAQTDPQQSQGNPAAQLNYQQPQMAPLYRAPVPLYAQQHSPMFLQATVDSRGTPTLPPWKTQPEEVIGHFHVDFMGVAIRQVNGPPSNPVDFTKDQKWRGNRHRPCNVWLTQVQDGSGGYYFNCMENRYGPRGWIYPIAKRGPQDKVTPWAIFFNQP
jgi:hypothetical protein